MDKKRILSLIDEIEDKKEFEKFFINIITKFKNKKFIANLIEKKFDSIFEKIDYHFIKEIYFSIPLAPEIKLVLAKFLFRYGDITICKNILKDLRRFFFSLSSYNKYLFISLYSAIYIEEGEIKKALYYINKGLSLLPKKFSINLKILKMEIIRSSFSPETSYSKILPITKKLKDKRKYCSLLIEEGYLNLYKGKFKRAYDLIEKSLEIARNKKIYDLIVISSCALSLIERFMGNSERSVSILNSVEEIIEKCSFVGKYYFLIEKGALYIDTDKLDEAEKILSKINEEYLPPLLKTNYYLLLMRLMRKKNEFFLFSLFSERFFSSNFLEITKRWEGIVEEFIVKEKDELYKEILKLIKVAKRKKLIFFEFIFETSLLYFYLKKNRLKEAKKILINFEKYPEEFFGYFLRESSLFYKLLKDNIYEFMFSKPYLKKIIMNILSNRKILLDAIKKNSNIIDFIPDIIIEKRIYSSSIIKELKKKRDKKIKKILKDIICYFQIEPPSLIVKFFGNFEIILGDEKIVLERKKVRQLFKILVFMKNKWVSKRKIIEILYGEYSEKHLKSLAIIFSFLKNEMEIFLESDKECYRFLEKKNVYIDYFDLNEKKNIGIDLFERKDYKRALFYFEKFINESENDFLEEDKGIEFFEEIAFQLKKERIRILEKMSFIYQTLNNNEKAIDCLEKIIKLDPYLEFPYQHLISLYTKIGEEIKAKIIKEKYESLKCKNFVNFK